MSGEWQFTDFYDIAPLNLKKETPSLKQYTDITVLLDRSGSMATIKESMQTAFDNFIKEHKATPSTKITLVQFDNQNDNDVVYQCVPVGSVEKLKLTPRGDTPLIDAFVKVIDSTGRRLSGMRVEDRPDQVLLVVITDGQENSSRIYKRRDVQDRVTKQRESYNWQFIYLGANQDAIGEAATYGIPQQYAITYTPTQVGTASSFNSLMSNTVSYTATAGNMRSKQAQGFTNEQRLDAVEDDPTLVAQVGNVNKI